MNDRIVGPNNFGIASFELLCPDTGHRHAVALVSTAARNIAIPSHKGLRNLLVGIQPSEIAECLILVGSRCERFPIRDGAEGGGVARASKNSRRIQFGRGRQEISPGIGRKGAVSSAFGGIGMPGVESV